MSHSFGIVIESLVAVLLLLTIGYCMLLNTRLKRLKADEHSLKATIGELITATRHDVELIVGQLAPTFANTAFPLRPVACNVVPVLHKPFFMDEYSEIAACCRTAAPTAYVVGSRRRGRHDLSDTTTSLRRPRRALYSSISGVAEMPCRTIDAATTVKAAESTCVATSSRNS